MQKYLLPKPLFLGNDEGTFQFVKPEEAKG